MTIDFSAERWHKVKTDARQWWAGELGRPLIQVRLTGKEPGRKEPPLPSHEFASFYDLNVPAEAIIDRWDYDLCRTLFLGDAFPHVFPELGPGVIAAFLGAERENGQDTVWFDPSQDVEITDTNWQFNPENEWYVRCKDLIQAALERWQGSVQCGLTDLGGNLDILSSFRPSEKLVLDLYDFPDRVKQLTWKIHELWWTFFEEFAQMASGTNPGYSSWAAIYSEEPHYMLQCDFCYMISPAMFDEFVKPGIDGYQSIQESAGMDIVEVQKRYGDKFVVWGGVWVEHLITGRPDDVRKDVDRFMREVAPNNGCILGTSHSVAVGTKYDNFMAMLDQFTQWI